MCIPAWPSAGAWSAASWISGRTIKLLPIPALGLVGLLLVWRGLKRRSHGLPYVGAALVFLSGYLAWRRASSRSSCLTP